MMRTLPILFVCLAVSGLAACGSKEKKEASSVLGDIALGAADAPVEIIEYLSLTCSHCRTFHTAILPTLKEKFIDTGKVRFIMREFPTPPQTLAIAGASLVRCAGPDASHSVLDQLFARQYEMLKKASEGGAIGVLMEIGAAHDMSEDDVRACLKDRTIIETIQANIEEAQSRGIRATPTLYINGDRLSPSEVRIDTISKIIEDLLSKQGGE